MKIYDRHERTYIEVEQYGAGKLRFLYGNAFGRVLLKLAVSPLTSRIYGRIKSTRRSASKIPGFVEEYGIDMSDYEDREYTSFNDFFSRKLKPGKRPLGEGFISPADSKLLVYDIKDELLIKGRTYKVSELTGREDEDFEGGHALVFRLCMDDCHRFCYPAKGKCLSRNVIKGKLHTVSPISKDYKIYKENTRNVSILETEDYGKIAFIEVGAILVGRIVDNGDDFFEKGQEKGYFEIGGSTIVVLTAPNIKIDEDILEQSRKGIETIVRYGERIGERC